jgi:Na+-exporting ATPase
MAAGTKIMVKRNVVVRNMRSLEALGGVTSQLYSNHTMTLFHSLTCIDICSDKTGTLTQGKMVTRMAWIPSHGTYVVDTSSDPYDPEAGSVTFQTQQPIDLNHLNEKGSAIDPHQQSHDSLQHYLDIATFANLATVKRATGDDQSKSKWEVHGDPTEVAIQVFAARFGRYGLTEGSGLKQMAEFPFDSSVKKMSVVCRNDAEDKAYIFTKGAVERVLDSCTSYAPGDGETAPLTDAFKDSILANMESLASRGLRVLALASGADVPPFSEEDARLGKLQRGAFEQSLVFRGLVGIYDPPRPESRTSVFKCHQADVRVHMLTGDHPATARSIAAEVGILPSRPDLLRADVAESLVMTAHEFDGLSDAQIDALPELPLVVARCAPSTKVRMIDALHRRGCYVAMTGDGVNDSPSLKRADIGIAMGLGGSDVAKSAADIILSDDNFASILNAIEEGRRIFDNVQKFMLHVLAANVGLVITLLLGLM